MRSRMSVFSDVNTDVDAVSEVLGCRVNIKSYDVPLESLGHILHYVAVSRLSRHKTRTFPLPAGPTTSCP